MTDKIKEFRERRENRLIDAKTRRKFDDQNFENKHARDKDGKFAPMNSKDVESVENKYKPRLNGEAKKSLAKMKSRFSDDAPSAVYENVPNLMKNLRDRQGFRYSYNIGDDTWTTTVQRFGSTKSGKPVYSITEENNGKKHYRQGSYDDISDEVCSQMTDEEVTPESIEAF